MFFWCSVCLVLFISNTMACHIGITPDKNLLDNKLEKLWVYDVCPKSIHRFPEDKVHKGRMDCMRRWRIQGTVLTSGNASISTCPQHLQSWALNRISIFNYHLLHSENQRKNYWLYQHNLVCWWIKCILYDYRHSVDLHKIHWVYLVLGSQ